MSGVSLFSAPCFESLIIKILPSLRTKAWLQNIAAPAFFAKSAKKISKRLRQTKYSFWWTAIFCFEEKTSTREKVFPSSPIADEGPPALRRGGPGKQGNKVAFFEDPNPGPVSPSNVRDN